MEGDMTVLTFVLTIASESLVEQLAERNSVLLVESQANSQVGSQFGSQLVAGGSAAILATGILSSKK
jgi:hypothetical protein